MKPFDKKYILEKIEEYNKIIKPNVVGDFEIKIINGLQGIVNHYMYSVNEDFNINILELHNNKNIWMRLTPYEIEASYFPIKMAKGNVGVVGLGLGYVAQEMAKNKNVKEVTVYEISKDVIDLYYKNFEKNDKIKIIHGDAFNAEGKRFDFFYCDIYQYKLTSQVAKDYKKFNKIHNIEEYSFFGMEHFLLSCSYEEIVWVYIPENWMESSKKAYNSLQENNLINYYEKLDEKLVSQVLQEFKIVLNDI